MIVMIAWWSPHREKVPGQKARELITRVDAGGVNTAHRNPENECVDVHMPGIATVSPFKRKGPLAAIAYGCADG